MILNKTNVDMVPYSQSLSGNDFAIDVIPEKNATDFVLLFRAFALNLRAHAVSVRCHVKQPSTHDDGHHNHVGSALSFGTHPSCSSVRRRCCRHYHERSQSRSTETIKATMVQITGPLLSTAVIFTFDFRS